MSLQTPYWPTNRWIWVSSTLEIMLAQQLTTEERILGYMQELVRQQAQARPNLIALPANGEKMDLLQAASGCRESDGQAELQDFHAYAEQQEWIWRNSSGTHQGTPVWPHVRG